jgi:hypothetical protein
MVTMVHFMLGTFYHNKKFSVIHYKKKWPSQLTTSCLPVQYRNGIDDECVIEIRMAVSNVCTYASTDTNKIGPVVFVS